MSATEREALWLRLQEARLVEGAPPSVPASPSPWFVRAMLGIAGWIGALFLFAFVGIGFAFVIENEAASIIVGALVCGGAAFAFRAAPNSDFMTQFGLAVSLAGQGLILAGTAQSLEPNAGAIGATMAVVQATLFFLIPNFVHRVWAAWTGALAVAVAVSDWGLQSCAPALLTAGFAWIWLNELEHGREGPKWRAGGYGLALAMLQVILLQAGAIGWIWRELVDAYTEMEPLIGAGLSGAVLIWMVVMLLNREGVPPGSPVRQLAYLTTAIAALASFKIPGLCPAVAILLAGYANGNRVLTGLGVLALISYLSQYYYSLEVSLLVKSVILVSVGVGLLSVRLLMRRFWPQSVAGATEHA